MLLKTGILTSHAMGRCWPQIADEDESSNEVLGNLIVLVEIGKNTFWLFLVNLQ